MVGLFVRVCEMFVLFGALWTLSVVRLYEELVLFLISIHVDLNCICFEL